MWDDITNPSQNIYDYNDYTVEVSYGKIAFHTLLRIWFLIHEGIEIKPC